MNQFVKEFIAKKNTEFEYVKMEEKRMFMDTYGISKKIYEDEEPAEKLSTKERAAKYPYSDYANGFYRRYRREYPEFTDEEFEAMKKAQERVDAARPVSVMQESSDKSEKTNGLSTFLTILAVILYLVAFIAGIALANREVLHGSVYSYTTNEFDIDTAIVYWGVGLFSGSLMLGFANIVDNLNKQTELLKAVLRR